jgi:hypothetical protein
MRHRVRLLAVLFAVVFSLSSYQAAAYSPLVFSGGPVLSPEIVPFFLGAWTSDGNQDNDPLLLTAYLRGLAGYVSGAPSIPGGSQIGLDPVTRQYGVVGARVIAGFSQGVGSDTVVRNTGIYQRIHSLQATGQLPPNTPNRVFVVFLKGFQAYDFSDGGFDTTACAYHSLNNGTYYAVIPWERLPNADGSNCSMQDASAHELLEMMTDPFPYNGWVTNEGFFGTTHNEGGDSCLGVNTVTNFGNVQMFADNTTASCKSYISSMTPHLSVTKAAGHVLDVFWPLPSPSSLGHAWLTSGAWQSETISASSITGLNFVGAPAVVAASPNRIDVFARVVNGDLLHAYKDFAAANPHWVWTVKLQTSVGPPSVTSYTTNRIDLVFQNWDSSVGHSWSNDGGNTFFTERWESQAMGGPKIITRGNGLIDVFTMGMHADLVVNSFNAGWSGFRQISDPGFLPVPPAAVSAGPNQRFILQEFPFVPYGFTYTASTGSNYGLFGPFIFDPAYPNRGTNTAWGSLDAVSSSNGIDAAWLDWNVRAYHYVHFDASRGWNNVSGMGFWNAPINLGGAFAAPPVITYGADGKVYVLGYQSNGCLYTMTVTGGIATGPTATGVCNFY